MNTITKKFIQIVSVIFVILSVNTGNAVEVKSSVDRNQLRVGDTLTFSLAIVSDQPVGYQPPVNPIFENFDILRTWTDIESKSLFRGGQFQVLRIPKFHYLLRARVVGTHELGLISIQVGGKTIKSPIAKVKVAKTGGQRQAFPRIQSGPKNAQDDLFGSLLKRQHSAKVYRSNPADFSGSFFIQVELNKDKLYLGEELLASWYIYAKGSVRDIDTLKFPSLIGFWKEDIAVATRLVFRNEVVNGYVYRKALLASYSLFPMRVGQLEIDSYLAKCTVILLAQGFRMQVPKIETHSSSAIPIDIIALPKLGRSDNFTGGVGRFQLAIEGDIVTNTEVGQPIRLAIKVSGTGNAKLVDFPKVEWPKALELFEMSNKAKYYKTRKSEKVFYLTFIPKEPGKIEMPPIGIEFYDPVQKSYYTRKIAGYIMTVAASDAPIAAGLEKFIPLNPLLEVSEAKLMLPALWTGKIVTPKISPTTQSFLWWVWVVFITGILLLQAKKSFGWMKNEEDLLSEVKKRFKKIENDLSHESWRKVGIGVTNLIYFLVGEVSGEGGAAHPMNQLMLKVSPSFRKEVSQPLNRLMREFEIISFAPDAVVNTIDKKVFKKQVKEIKKLLIGVLEKGTAVDKVAI